MSIAIRIRPEEPGDVRDIWHVTQRAFTGRPYSDGSEADIIDLLRGQGALAISLVAEHAGGIVGHVAFSPAVPEDRSPGWYTLGPVSVEPDNQRQGIGKALIRAGIARLQELNAAGCIVLGDTNYYSQFGFAKAPELAPAGEPRGVLHGFEPGRAGAHLQDGFSQGLPSGSPVTPRTAIRSSAIGAAVADQRHLVGENGWKPRLGPEHRNRREHTIAALRYLSSAGSLANSRLGDTRLMTVADD